VNKTCTSISFNEILIKWSNERCKIRA